MRLVIADDEDLTRSALVALLELEPDITVVEEVRDGDAAITATLRHRPDLVMLDLEMPRRDGVDAAAAIRAEHEIPIVLVTRHARPGVLRRALAAGVQGFVPKTTPAARLISILREIHGGGRYIDAEIAAVALTEGACPLTERELDVLRLARRGGSVVSIAEQIHLAPGTVRNYLSSAMSKLQATTRHEAARIAYEEGWI